MTNITTRGFTPSTYDPKSKTFTATVTTEQAAQVWDWDSFDVISEVLLMKGATWPAIGQAPLLDAHSRESTQNILGSARNFRIVGDELLADIHLTDGPQGEAIGRKIQGGHLTDLSVGYQVEQSRFIHDGEVQVIDGREYKGPLRVATKWKIFEVSLTPIGADSRAKVRSSSMDVTTTTRPDQVPSTRSAEDAVSAERERVSQITEKCLQAGLHEYAKRFIADGTSVADATDAIFSHMARKHPPLGTRADMFDDAGFVEMGQTEGSKRQAALIDGMLLRTGQALEKPAPGANEFRNMSMLDHAKNCLNNAGINPRGMSKSEVMSKALTTRTMHTISDFPALLSNFTGKLLRESYMNSPATFQEWTSKGSADTFLPQRRVVLSEAPDMEIVNEAAEYTFGTMGDGEEVFSLVKVGKAFSLSFEALVSDSLDGFSRTLRAFTASARRYVNQSVYAKLSGSHVMSDGKQLFHADHGNLAGTGGALSIDTLTAARLAMRKQAGMNSAYPLNIQPRFLLVPASLETEAAKLIDTASGFDAEEGHGVSNPFYRALQIIVDPYLDTQDAVAWYLAADPKMQDGVELCYLDGNEWPVQEQEYGFEIDSWKCKVRHVFAVGVLDWRGLYKNEGPAG